MDGNLSINSSESHKQSFKNILESLPWQTLVQGQFWLFSLCVLLSECCMVVKIGTYQSLCICGGSGWLWCQHTRKNRDFSFGISLYLNYPPYYPPGYVSGSSLIFNHRLYYPEHSLRQLLICEFNTDFSPLF